MTTSEATRAGWRERARRRRAIKGDEIRALNRARYAAKPELIRAQVKASAEKVKQAVLDHYGRECACCRSTSDLTIDHIDGGGSAHRAELFGDRRSGVQFWRWLREQGYPDGYQTLCWTCNRSKGTTQTCRLHP